MQGVLLFNKWFIGLMMMYVANVHPYHVSATEMEYNTASKQIEISTKIFTDDFEAVLAKLYKQKVDLSKADMHPQMTELIKKYITTHLSIRNNNKLLPLTLFGWEIDHEAVYVYTTAKAPSFNPKQIIIQKTVLYDLFDDQVNILHFIYNGKRKSTKLNYPEKQAVISF